MDFCKKNRLFLTAILFIYSMTLLTTASSAESLSTTEGETSGQATEAQSGDTGKTGNTAKDEGEAGKYEGEAGKNDQSDTENEGSGGKFRLNEIHEGEISFFKTTGKGACMLGRSPDDLMLAAVNNEVFADSTLCGSYLNIKGPDGEVMVRVADLCPGCAPGHIDLSPEAFSKVADLSVGRAPITWKIVSPELEGPIAYYLKAPNAENVGLVQVRNHRNQIAKVEFQKKGNQWIEIPRVTNNYFEYYAGMGPGPFTFRVTDIYGNELIDENIAYVKGKSIDGEKQLPAAPGIKTK